MKTKLIYSWLGLLLPLVFGILFNISAQAQEVKSGQNVSPAIYEMVQQIKPYLKRPASSIIYINAKSVETVEVWLDKNELYEILDKERMNELPVKLLENEKCVEVSVNSNYFLFCIHFYLI